MSSASAQPGGEYSSEPSASSSQSRALPHEQKKRRQVTVACNECRKKKVKCDGLRPSCSQCDARDLTCFYEADPDATPIVALKRKYDQLQRHSQESEEILEMLRTRPDVEAMAILQRIRTSDVASALTMIKDGDLLIPERTLHSQPVRNLLPPLSTLTAHKRTTREWVASNSLAPMDRTIPDPLTAFEGSLSRQERRAMFEPQLRYTDIPSYPYKDDSRTSLPSPVKAMQAETVRDHSWAPHRRHNTDTPALYDTRLQNARASLWTSVVVENTLFARIISTYLTWDHPPWRLFDEDLFIHDLMTGRAVYCSKLLVNAILAYACQNYAAIDTGEDSIERAQTLGFLFFVEAKQLWQLEEGTESLACIAASALLHGLHSCRGKDKVGHTYLVQGVRMAKDMGLFRQKTAVDIFRVDQPELRKARATVAWGLFSYVVSHAMYMHRDTLLTTPPPVPIPNSPSLLAPPSSTPAFTDPWHISKTFKASCELWLIVKDWLPLYYNEGEPGDMDTKALTVAVQGIYLRLEEWLRLLPSELEDITDALPHVINLRMQYHCVVAELSRPFVGEMPQITIKDPLPDDFPMEVAVKSMDHLRSIVFQYVSKYDGPPVSVSMLGSLLCVTYAAIRRLEDQEWRFFFAVCIKFLGEMVEYFPVVRFILRAIYFSAARTRTSFPPEAMCVFDYFGGTLMSVHVNEVESSYPVDLNLSRTDLEGARLSNLIRGTGGITLKDK